jgi:tetratricopeptide (TPR) repeat protein
MKTKILFLSLVVGTLAIASTLLCSQVQAAPVLTSTLTVAVPETSVGIRQLLIEQDGIDRLLNNDPVGATDKFAQLLASDPSDVFALNNQANAQMQLGEVNQSLANYDRAILIDKSKSFLYFNRAIARTQANQLNEALADYNAALALNPQDARSLTNRGIVYAKLVNLTAALADFDAALKIDPTLATATYNRAHVRRLAGDSQGALVDYRMSSKLLQKQGFGIEARNAERRIASLQEELGIRQLPSP